MVAWHKCFEIFGTCAFIIEVFCFVKDITYRIKKQSKCENVPFSWLLCRQNLLSSYNPAFAAGVLNHVDLENVKPGHVALMLIDAIERQME